MNDTPIGALPPVFSLDGTFGNTRAVFGTAADINGDGLDDERCGGGKPDSFGLTNHRVSMGVASAP